MNLKYVRNPNEKFPTTKQLQIYDNFTYTKKFVTIVIQKFFAIPQVYAKKSALVKVKIPLEKADCCYAQKSFFTKTTDKFVMLLQIPNPFLAY